MKRKLKELVREETGQAFILVLILLLLGGLIMAPLLGFMGTGLKAGQAYEQRMAELYAADAGIEDAILKIMNGLAPIEYGLTVNGKDVWVQIPPEGGEDPMLDFFIDLGVLKDRQGTYNKNRPQQDWLMIYAPIVDENEMCYEYRITAFYFPQSGSGGTTKILSTGFWISNYNYEEPFGTTTAELWTEELDNHLAIDLNFDTLLTEVDLNVPPDGVMDVDEKNIITQPLIDPGYTNYIDEEPLGDGVTEIVDHLGRAFIWEWKPAKGPLFTEGVCRTQRFALTPPVSLGEFLHVAFLETTRNSIQISWSGEVITEFEGIRAIATSATGKSTTVLSYVFAQQDIPGGPVAITVLTWEVDLQ